MEPILKNSIFILIEMTPLPCKERYQFECLSLTFHLNLVRLSSPFSLLSIWRFARSHTSKHPALEKRRQTGISWLESMVAYSIFFLNPRLRDYGCNLIMDLQSPISYLWARNNTRALALPPKSTTFTSPPSPGRDRCPAVFMR